MADRLQKQGSPVRLLMIDNYDSFTFNLVQYLGELGAEVDVVRNDVEKVDELLERKPAGVVISPGPGEPKAAGPEPHPGYECRSWQYPNGWARPIQYDRTGPRKSARFVWTPKLLSSFHGKLSAQPSMNSAASTAGLAAESKIYPEFSKRGVHCHENRH